MFGIQEWVMVVHIQYLLLVLPAHVHSLKRYEYEPASHGLRSPCTSAAEVHNKKLDIIWKVNTFAVCKSLSMLYTQVTVGYSKS